MTTIPNWPLLERLTNDEFLKLLPHLSLEQYFLTQVFVPRKKWIRLLEANLLTLQLKCSVCKAHVRFEDIKNHLTQNNHTESLRSNVKQFYHPFYTYGKADIKLARGEPSSQKMRELALREVNMQMKSFKKECILARQFANIVRRRARTIEREQIIESDLNSKIENPDDLSVSVSLPLEEISKLQFSVRSGEWQTAFGYKNLPNKLILYCHICSVNCSGIESFNSHLNGHTHRLKQLEVMALCYENSSRVNKKCYFQFGISFLFSVNEDEKINSDSWINNLRNEITGKVLALNEYVPKISKCEENNLHQNNIKKYSERVRRFESSEKLGHLGVEYVLKIVENDQDPIYECGLCEFVGNDRKMQRHILLYDHKKKYLDFHYSDTIKKYEASIGHICYKEFRAVMGEIVFKVASKIEQHHGRSLPYTVSLNAYKSHRADLIAEAYALLHACQNRGPSFSDALSKDDIRNFKNSATYLPENNRCGNTECIIIFTTAPKDKVYLNQMSHDPVIRIREYNAKRNKSRSLITSRSISPTSNQVYDSTRKDDTFIRSRSPICARTGTPIQRGFLSQNIWDVYRREIAIAANEIEISYENYRKNPESHPLYEEEWNIFWHRRKRELECEGYNHRSHNFQLEWIHYFKQRIEVLFGEALHKSQINIRHGLQIPFDAEEDCDRSHESANIYAINRGMKYNVTVNEEIDIFTGYKRRSSDVFKSSFPKNRKLLSEDARGEGNIDLNVNELQLIIPKIRDNHSNIVHVLRLMTALEEHLGSLGEKVMDLFSNSLQLEKHYSCSSVEFDAKILTVPNCHLLETAMEKLKGVLFAGVLDENKISGFNRVIQHISNLLKYAEKMGWRQENRVFERKFVHNSDTAMTNQGHTFVPQDKNSGLIFQGTTEKPLSDTLIDLVHMSETNIKQIPREQFRSHAKEHFIIPDCPPPPNINDITANTNICEHYKGQQLNSGLASFDTKLSIDQDHRWQKLQRDNLELAFLNRNKLRGGSNLYNNSFRNNNDTRTNIYTHKINGPSMGGGMKKSNGTSPEFRN